MSNISIVLSLERFCIIVCVRTYLTSELVLSLITVTFLIKKLKIYRTKSASIYTANVD